MIQLFLISLAFQEIHTEVILFNQSYSSQLERLYFKEFIPQNFNFQKENIILISLYIQQIGTQKQEMSVCFRSSNCIFDQNAIDFKKNIQNIRVMNQSNIPNVVIAQYNAISYYEDLYINVVSSSLFQIMIKLVDINFCPEQCENQGICQFGICICKESFIGSNCQFQSLNLQEVQILKDSFYYYLNINEMKNQDMVFYKDLQIHLSNYAKIVVQCIAIKPYLKLNETEVESNTINLPRTDLLNCDLYYQQLKQYNIDLIPYIIIKLIYPDQVNIILQTSDGSFEPLVIGLIIGCVSIFLIFMIGYGIYRCRRDEQQNARFAAEILEKKKLEQKMEDLKNQYMPLFKYEEAIKKFPGLKSDQECEICLNQFKEEEEVRITYCTHIFHSQCLKSWLEKNQTCPMCRQSLDIKSIQNQLICNENINLNQKSMKTNLLSTPIFHNQSRLFITFESDNQTRNHEPNDFQNVSEFKLQKSEKEVQKV